MNNVVRKAAVALASAGLSIAVLGAVGSPADAAVHHGKETAKYRMHTANERRVDTSWGW